MSGIPINGIPIKKRPVLADKKPSARYFFRLDTTRNELQLGHLTINLTPLMAILSLVVKTNEQYKCEEESISRLFPAH